MPSKSSALLGLNTLLTGSCRFSPIFTFSFFFTKISKLQSRLSSSNLRKHFKICSSFWNDSQVLIPDQCAINKIYMHQGTCTLHEKCPNSRFFLVRIFPHIYVISIVSFLRVIYINWYYTCLNFLEPMQMILPRSGKHLYQTTLSEFIRPSLG